MASPLSDLVSYPCFLIDWHGSSEAAKISPDRELVQNALCILAVDNFLASFHWFHENFYSLSPSFSMSTSVISVSQLVRTLKCAGFPKLSLRILSVDDVPYINKTNIESVAISS